MAVNAKSPPLIVKATAELKKETHNSLVYVSLLGQSLYFNKECFEGEKPKKLTIQLSWEASQTNTI